jgi:hypothetical protein
MLSSVIRVLRTVNVHPQREVDLVMEYSGDLMMHEASDYAEPQMHRSVGKVKDDRLLWHLLPRRRRRLEQTESMLREPKVSDHELMLLL